MCKALCHVFSLYPNSTGQLQGIIPTLPGNSSLLVYGYTCAGNEDRLVECSQLDLSSGCSGSDALTIQCSSEGIFLRFLKLSLQ